MPRRGRNQAGGGPTPMPLQFYNPDATLCNYYGQSGGGPTPMPLQYYNPSAVPCQRGGRSCGGNNLSDYQKFMKKELPRVRQQTGGSPQSCMKIAAGNWKKQKKQSAQNQQVGGVSKGLPWSNHYEHIFS